MKTVSYYFITAILISILSISCGKNDVAVDGNEPDSGDEMTDLPDFVKVESSGSYTFLSTTTNTAGGETVSIPAEYYICQYAAAKAAKRIPLTIR